MKSNPQTEKIYSAAKMGDAEAQYSLGGRYYCAEDDSQDYAEAFKWYCRAAEQGHAGALDMVARMYRDGDGVSQNYETSVKIYWESAKLGCSDAYGHLSYMYAGGMGVQKDENVAKLLMDEARRGFYKESIVHDPEGFVESIRNILKI